MLKTNKKYHIFNPQILSESGDSIRDIMNLSVTVDDDGNIILPSNTGLPSAHSFINKYELSKPLTVRYGLTSRYVYGLRLHGDESKVKSDKHWLSYINGGAFNEESFTGIYTEGTFLDHQHEQDVPYTIVETKLNQTFDTSAPNTVSIKPFMKSFYSHYYSYIQDLNNVRQIPNMYEIFNQQSDKEEKQIKQILNSELPNNKYIGTLSSEELLENVFVCSNSVYEDIEELNNYAELFSFSNIFEMNFDKTGQILKSVIDNNFTNRFTKVLKDCFFNEEEAPSFDLVPFSILIKEIGQTQDIETTSLSLDLKVVDVLQMLDYSLREYNTENSNFKYLIDNSEEANSQYDSRSIRRLEKTIPTLKQIKSVIDFVRTSNFEQSFTDQPINLNTKYNEVVAYRLEKIGGPATGDENTQKPIQNFWFLNLEDVDEFKFHDSQIFYGQQFTYNVYKYVLVAGLQYTYSNITVSRTIADLDNDNTPATGWCLEMFDPDTSQPKQPILQSTFISDLGNQFASDAQIRSSDKYLADLNLTLEPSVKIVEVPIFTKNVTVLDAPTNKTGVYPFYYLNSSNKIGFTNRYLPLTPSPFPTALNPAEQEYKQSFESSYDLIQNEDVTFSSVSLPTKMQIFRTEERPESIEDFDGKLINSVSIRTENREFYFSDKTVVDKVKVNKKYYYLFRIINELESPAYNSQILEAMLTDDGGYKFATFNVIFENELPTPVFSNPLKQVKKIFNIIPNFNNITLQDAAVDYSEPAESQITNISFGDPSKELVWDKKYKIRVTSKKTGKKLDINLTFKLDG